MKFNRKIIKHLFANQEFLEALPQEFTAEEITTITSYLHTKAGKYPAELDRLHDWVYAEIFSGGTTVLCIGWDSSSWGPGGSGAANFALRFGLVSMSSSDYSDDHVEIFKKHGFEPWCIENLYNEYVSLDSDIYDEAELLSIAESMGMNDDTQLTINDKEIER